MTNAPWDTGLVVLAADRSVTFATERALALLACAAGDCRRVLEPILDELPGSGSQLSLLGIDGRDDVPPRQVAVEAHTLPARSGWLLEITPEDSADRAQTMIADGVRARLWARLRPAMHHDFKAPIQSMLWSIEILEKSAAGADAEERRHASLGILRKEVASLQLRLQALLEDIAPMDYDTSTIDAGELLHHAAHVTRSEAGLYGVDVEVDAAEHELFVTGQRGPLKEALLLVLFSALDHLREGGSLRLSASREAKSVCVVIDEQSPNAALRTPRQAETVTALQVAEQIVRSHGGKLEVIERTGGTRFAIRLPVAKTPGN